MEPTQDNHLRARKTHWPFLMGLLLFSCHQTATKPDNTFIEHQNAAHNGDYLATYPLHNPDSCLLRLKAEVPAKLQPWACMSLWYHLPRTSRTVSFRLLELYDQHYPHDTVFAFTQMVRGEFLVELHQHDSARVVLADARSRYLKLHRPLDASDADYLVARCCLQENNPAKALESYFRVLDLINAHDTTFSHRHISLYQDIAAAFGQNKDYSKALFWLKKAWNSDNSKLSEPWKYRFSTALKMSTNYAKINRFDSSLTMATLAADIFSAHSKKTAPAELAYRLGFAYLKKRDYATALRHFSQAARGSINSPNSFMKNQIEQSLGEAYFCLGQLDSAEFFTRRSLATPDTGNLSAAHRRLGEIYARRGDFKIAYTEERAGNILFRSAFATEKATALAEFQARYETVQKERRIAELEAQQKIAQQQHLIIALSLLLLLIGAVSLYFRQRARQRLLQQEKQLAEARTLLHQQALKRSEADLSAKQQELEETAQLLQFKEQLVADLEMRLSEQAAAPSDMPGEASQHFPRMKILTPNDWLKFQEVFEHRFPGYAQRLKTRFPELTNAETRLFLLIKLGFDSREMADIQGISVETIWRSRNRLRKKLKPADTGEMGGFDQFIQQF